MEIDLVDATRVQLTHPGVDSDANNLKIDRSGRLCLKVPAVGAYISLEKSIKHIRQRKFVFLYNLEAENVASRDMAERRLLKMLSKGYTCKSPVSYALARKLTDNADRRGQVHAKAKYAQRVSLPP